MAFEGGEVRVGRDGGRVVRQLDEAVVVLRHEPLVDDAAGEDVRHVSVEDLDFGEGPVGGALRELDAPVLGEEDGDGVVVEEVVAFAVRRGYPIAVAAPRVHVVPPEIDLRRVARVSWLAGEIGGEVVARGHVSCGIADAQGGAVGLRVDVALDVAHGGFDEGGGGRLVARGDVLIAGEEADDVLVFGEGVDDAGVALVEGHIPFWVVGLDGQLGLA